MLHHCVRENNVTQDSYYIVKNIICQVMRTVPSLKNYIRFQEHNVRTYYDYKVQFLKEMLSVFDPDKLDL